MIDTYSPSTQGSDKRTPVNLRLKPAETLTKNKNKPSHFCVRYPVFLSFTVGTEISKCLFYF